MIKINVSAQKRAALTAVILSTQLAACASSPTFGELMSSKASSIESYSDEWKKGAELIDDGEDLIKDGEKSISKGEKEVKEGNELIRKASADIESSRQSYRNISLKVGQSRDAAAVAREAEVLEDIARVWKEADTNMTKGNKLISKGNERINKGQTLITSGNKKMAEGRALKLESEKKYQDSYSRTK